MRRIGLVTMMLTIILAGVALVHVVTKGEQWVLAQAVTVDDPWVGVWGEIDCDNEYVTCDVQFGALLFEDNGVPYYDSVTFNIGNAYPGVDVHFRLQVHNRGLSAVVLQREEYSRSGHGPCMETVSWQVNGEAGDLVDLEGSVIGVPIAIGETLSLGLQRRVSPYAPQNHSCWERYVASISLPTEPPSPPPAPAVAGDSACFFDVDMLGEVTRVYVTCDDSRCVDDYEAEDPVGRRFLDLIEGTQVTHEHDGEFLGSSPRWVRMRVSGKPPPIPSGMVALSDVYDFTGFTALGEPVSTVFFDQQVGVEFPYDPDALPEDTTDVGIGYWNSATGQWQLLPQSTGRIAGVGTATADVTHFSTFAVLATVPVEKPPVREVVVPPQANPAVPSFSVHGLLVNPDIEHLWGPIRVLTHSGRSATVQVTATNRGDAAGTFTAELLLDRAVAGRQEVALDVGERTVISFTLQDLPNGVHRVEVAGLKAAFTTYQQVNWWVIALAVGLLLTVILTLVRLTRRGARVKEGHTA